MKRERYMSKAELTSWLFCGAIAGQLAAIAKTTKEADWLRKIKTAATYMENITNERLQCLDKDQLMSVIRRRKGTSVVMHSEDKDRYSKVEKELVTVDLDDLETLAELALDTCRERCMRDRRADLVKSCPYRKAYHRLGIEPAVNSCDPGPDFCEFISR